MKHTLLALSTLIIALSAFAWSGNPIISLKGRVACELIDALVQGSPHFVSNRIQMGTVSRMETPSLRIEALNSRDGNQFYCYFNVTPKAL